TRQLCLLGLLAGCAAATTAVIDGQVVPRLNVELTGQPYIVHHRGAHPRPGSPSGGLRDSGGTITGQVCGADIDYGVEHKGDHVQLVGFVDGSLASQVRAEEKVGVRLFTGALTT